MYDLSVLHILVGNPCISSDILHLGYKYVVISLDHMWCFIVLLVLNVTFKFVFRNNLAIVLTHGPKYVKVTHILFGLYVVQLWATFVSFNSFLQNRSKLKHTTQPTDDLLFAVRKRNFNRLCMNISATAAACGTMQFTVRRLYQHSPFQHCQ
jgi:hypothetical protein